MYCKLFSIFISKKPDYCTKLPMCANCLYSLNTAAPKIKPKKVKITKEVIPEETIENKESIESI